MKKYKSVISEIEQLLVKSFNNFFSFKIKTNKSKKDN
jgi:hypothetical protein